MNLCSRRGGVGSETLSLHGGSWAFGADDGAEDYIQRDYVKGRWA